jgi:hypothetical protein
LVAGNRNGGRVIGWEKKGVEKIEEDGKWWEEQESSIKIKIKLKDGKVVRQIVSRLRKNYPIE